MAKKNKKVVRYKRPLNINVGMIIFAIIFLYLVFSVYTYLKREKIQFYEVVDGGIVSNRMYTGLILREEQVRNADRSGYINYYLREGKRASVGSRIYSLDETGSLEELLKDNAEAGNSLSDDSLSDLKKQLTSFVLSFRDQDFSSIYDARYSLEASVMEYSSFSALDQLDKLAQESGAVFEQVRTDVSGVVSYGFDNYETVTTADIGAASFNRDTYVKTLNKSGKLIDSGSPAYKIITSENWSIVFPLTEEDASLYSDKTTLRVIFRDYSMSTPASYSTFTGKDGASYGKLDFTKYMEQFISDRFIDFEIKTEQTDGLKIPASAVTEKSFYLIPIDYMTQGGDSSESGFNKEVYTENGSSVVFVPTTIYYSDDEFFYVDMNEEEGFKAGDYVVKPSSSERYQIGRTASLKGVYNINKGYTIFKQIDILDSNNEFYTIRRNMTYGLSVYDHIVLDASMVEEGQLLYQ
ncbi:HlyD family efflux transporter periplasmic adaptor subunit [Enterocloster citroniae]|uniref:HlyD family efflux transporter periplasmic adaptor subunit n=1 Tax=Enterocloster citroniae TaxID=358743 RepID=UPI0032C1E5EA